MIRYCNLEKHRNAEIHGERQTDRHKIVRTVLNGSEQKPRWITALTKTSSKWLRENRICAEQSLKILATTGRLQLDHCILSLLGNLYFLNHLVKTKKWTRPKLWQLFLAPSGVALCVGGAIVQLGHRGEGGRAWEPHLWGGCDVICSWEAWAPLAAPH